jgi:ATP-binding cassette subfamily B protein
MTRSAVQATTNSYSLASGAAPAPEVSLLTGIKRLRPIMSGEQRSIALASAAIIYSSTAALFGPLIIAHAVDTYIPRRDFRGVLLSAAVLLTVYLGALGTQYFQTLQMGSVGRRILFNLRNSLFTKLQSLPVAFFNQNKAGDLISRINNDTDKLNLFFSQAFVQFTSNLFLMVGAAIFVISLNPRLGIAALLPSLGVLILTQAISGWVKKKNIKNLRSLGGMSAEIQESLSNFKVIVAFNRTDYFRKKFDGANQQNFSSAVDAGIASNLFMPIYGLAHNLAQLAVLAYGFYLVSVGHVTVGLLIGFLLYVNSFYMPLRQIATLWSSLQLALAGLDRISEVLSLESNMPVVPNAMTADGSVLAFQNVGFGYRGDQDVLKDTTFSLQRGKTYALVGPTGGGKTTTASLLARLYDPNRGSVLLEGKDIRSYSAEERSNKIGFILQEPFLFTGSVRDNIVYANERYQVCSSEQLVEVLKQNGLGDLLARFEQGLDTKVTSSGDGISLGQKQIIAFMRAVLRDPEVLILDEATANIDTVTEQQLQGILDKLPAHTTKVIIAHRLNTIANADEIFFVNSGEITPAGSMEHAVDMLLHGKRDS